MRYFCGVQATGRGHLSRFAALKSMLEDAGHEVFGYASGRELPPYAQGIQRFDQGPSFFIKNNHIDLLGSFRYNATRIAAFYRSVSSISEVLRDGKFDDVIVDFEPISARAAVRARRPFTIFDNQTLTLLEFPYPHRVRRAVTAMRWFVRFYYGSVAKARRILTYSFAPLRPQLPGQQIIPPCIRSEVEAADPVQGAHILFYCSIGQIPRGLIEFAIANPSVEIRAYAPKAVVAESLPSNIIMPGTERYLEDFATCRVFIANAGFESLAEAVFLRKPTLIVPIRGQWEQEINAYLIEHFGIGLTADDFSAAAFEKALRHETPPSEELRDWVLQGRPSLEKALLGSA